MGVETIEINLLKPVDAVKRKARLPNSDFDAVK